MTYYDPNARERHDRMIAVYQFDADTPIIANLTCNGDTPQVAIDLGGSPLELELVIQDVVAIDGLINGLTAARDALIEHQADHATRDTGTDLKNLGDPNVPLFVPDTWADSKTNPDTGPSAESDGNDRG